MSDVQGKCGARSSARVAPGHRCTACGSGKGSYSQQQISNEYRRALRACLEGRGYSVN
jgi:hypothetical protein